MAADLVAVATGGFIGVICGLLTKVAFEEYKNTKTAKHLAQAFAGEIKALKTITEARCYREQLRARIESLQARGAAAPFQVKVRRDYLLVYKSNADRLGGLEEPLPEYLCTFYTLVNAILEDLDSLNDGSFDGLDAISLRDCYTEMLFLYEKADEFGDVILQVIRDKYSSSL